MVRGWWKVRFRFRLTLQRLVLRVPVRRERNYSCRYVWFGIHDYCGFPHVGKLHVIATELNIILGTRVPMRGVTRRLSILLTFRCPIFGLIRIQMTWFIRWLDRVGLRSMSEEYIFRQRWYLLNWAQDRPFLTVTRNLQWCWWSPQCNYCLTLMACKNIP